MYGWFLDIFHPDQQCPPGKFIAGRAGLVYGVEVEVGIFCRPGCVVTGSSGLDRVADQREPGAGALKTSSSLGRTTAWIAPIGIQTAAGSRAPVVFVGADENPLGMFPVEYNGISIPPQADGPSVGRADQRCQVLPLDVLSALPKLVISALARVSAQKLAGGTYSVR